MRGFGGKTPEQTADTPHDKHPTRRAFGALLSAQAPNGADDSKPFWDARSESKAPQGFSAAWYARKRKMCKRAEAGLQPLCPKSCCTKLEQSKEERREPSRE